MRARGFSLIELVVVIVLLGMLATISAALLRQPFDASAALQRRARLADDAEQAIARIARDLRLALPNSLRVSADGRAIELLRTRGGGRYRAQVGGSGGDVLDFAAADSSFEVLGGLSAAPVAGDWAVIYNLTASGPQANAWVGDNRAVVAAGSSSTSVQLAPAFRFPYPSPQQRVFIVDQAVLFRCDADVLWRDSGHAPTSSLQVPPTGGSSARLVDGVNACQFRYDPGAGSRHALVTLQLSLTREGETVSLQKSVHLPNAP